MTVWGIVDTIQVYIREEHIMPENYEYEVGDLVRVTNRNATDSSFIYQGMVAKVVKKRNPYALMIRRGTNYHWVWANQLEPYPDDNPRQKEFKYNVGDMVYLTQDKSPDLRAGNAIKIVRINERSRYPYGLQEKLHGPIFWASENEIGPVNLPWPSFEVQTYSGLKIGDEVISPIRRGEVLNAKGEILNIKGEMVYVLSEGFENPRWFPAESVQKVKSTLPESPEKEGTVMMEYDVAKLLESMKKNVEEMKAERAALTEELKTLADNPDAWDERGNKFYEVTSNIKRLQDKIKDREESITQYEHVASASVELSKATFLSLTKS